MQAKQQQKRKKKIFGKTPRVNFVTLEDSRSAINYREPQQQVILRNICLSAVVGASVSVAMGMGVKVGLSCRH